MMEARAHTVSVKSERIRITPDVKLQGRESVVELRSHSSCLPIYH